MHDHLIKAMAGDKLRIHAAVTTKLVDEARVRHDCWPVATAALGRTMTAAVLFAANFKSEEETVTLRIAGDGPLGDIIADAQATGFVRGKVRNPHVDLPLTAAGKLPVGEAVGAGTLHVIRYRDMKQSFTGSSPLVSGEIAEDVTSYLYTSEQIPSSVGLGVLVEPDLHVSSAGGFILQVMPGATDEDLSRIEQNLQAILPVSSLVAKEQKAESIIEAVCEGLPIRYLARQDLEFRCTCSKERVGQALISLGVHELEQLIAEDGQAELVCHFCANKYLFNRDELVQLKELLEKQAAEK